MPDVTAIAHFAGALLALVFLLAGTLRLTEFAEVRQAVSVHGLPLAAIWLISSICLEAAGGFLVLIGLHARWRTAADCRLGSGLHAGFLRTSAAGERQLGGDTARFAAGDSGRIVGAVGRGAGPVGSRRIASSTSDQLRRQQRAGLNGSELAARCCRDSGQLLPAHKNGGPLPKERTAAVANQALV